MRIRQTTPYIFMISDHSNELFEHCFIDVLRGELSAHHDHLHSWDNIETMSGWVEATLLTLGYMAAWIGLFFLVAWAVRRT